MYVDNLEMICVLAARISIAGEHDRSCGIELPDVIGQFEESRHGPGVYVGASTAEHLIFQAVDNYRGVIDGLFDKGLVEPPAVFPEALPGKAFMLRCYLHILLDTTKFCV